MEVSQYRQIARDHIHSFKNDIPLAPPSIRHPAFDELKSLSFPRLVMTLDFKTQSDDTQRALEDIIILKQYLADQKLQGDDEPCRNAVAVVRGFLIRIILPSRIFALRSPYAVDERPALTAYDLFKYHVMSSDGLVILMYLDAEYPILRDDYSNAVPFLTCVLSFTDLSDLWTCKSSRETARQLLEAFYHSRDSNTISTIISDLLREKVKPAFATIQNPAITQQARKAIEPFLVDSSALGGSEDATRPWKYRDIYLVTVLGWIIRSLGHLDVSFIEANWSFLILPLLSLLEDSSVMYKAKGCAFLRSFLRRVPPHLLNQTGLGAVFENTLMPCLMYLPSMTEEKDSLNLLEETYPALISLARIRYSKHENKALKLQALDRVVRDGLFRGYAQAGDHVKIADLLIQRMEELVNEMGIGFVKHLKHLILLLSANLAAPFAFAYPPLLMSSLRTLQAAILAAWPRISFHRAEILHGLTICWCKIEEEGDVSEDLRTVQQTLQDTVAMLTAVLKGEVDVSEEYRMITDSDKRLERLLAI